MADPTVFDRFGKPGISKDTPPACDTCQYFQVDGDMFWPDDDDATTVVRATFDTACDARKTYAMGRADLLKDLWKAAGDQFTCPPPGKACRVKKDCGPKPIYIEAGAETVVDGDGETRWAVYVKLGREIQCVGNDTGKDVEMEDPGMSPPSVVPKHQVLDDKKMLTLRRPARLTIRKKATAKKTIKKNTKEMIRISPRERRHVPVLFSPFSPCGSGFDMEK